MKPSYCGPWRRKRGLLSWEAAQARTQSSQRVQRSRSIIMAAVPLKKRVSTRNSISSGWMPLCRSSRNSTGGPSGPPKARSAVAFKVRLRGQFLNDRVVQVAEDGRIAQMRMEAAVAIDLVNVGFELGVAGADVTQALSADFQQLAGFGSHDCGSARDAAEGGD